MGTHAEELAFINPGSHGGYHLKDQGIMGYGDHEYGGVFLTQKMWDEGLIYPQYDRTIGFQNRGEKIP